jgi:hypothetical protein
MQLVAFCLRHFSADFIICTCEFEFRQAQGPTCGPNVAYWPKADYELATQRSYRFRSSVHVVKPGRASVKLSKRKILYPDEENFIAWMRNPFSHRPQNGVPRPVQTKA